MKIALYPTTITRAYSMRERVAGDTYTFQPWGADTKDYQGFSGEPDRVLELAEGVEFGRDEDGMLAFWLGDSIRFDYELIDRQGRIIDSRFGSTRKREPNEEVVSV